MCRSGNVNYLGDGDDNVEQKENESESQETELDPVAFAELTSKNGWDEYKVDNFSVMAISEAFEIKNATNLSDDNLNGHIKKLKKKYSKFICNRRLREPNVNSKQKTARRLQEKDKSGITKQIPPEDFARNLACYNVETIVPKGRLIVRIQSGGWKIRAALFIIVDNQKANIISSKILPQIGIKLVQ